MGYSQGLLQVTNFIGSIENILIPLDSSYMKSRLAYLF